MLKRTFFVLLLSLLFCSSASALTLEDIIYMSSAGVDDVIIIAKIDASGVVFDMSTREIVALWEAGVSAEVIEHMIATSSGAPVGAESSESEYEYYEYYDHDDIIVIRQPSTFSLHFGFGYYDGWYYPNWWWGTPYYYGYYPYGWYGYHWPYYYHCSPYYYDWNCWPYGDGWYGCSDRGIRHQWRRSGSRGDYSYGNSGYRLKPTYSNTAGKKGGYYDRDGRYVFPKGGDGRYTGTRGAYDKPSAYSGRSARTYGGKTSVDGRSYGTRSGRSTYSKPQGTSTKSSRKSKGTRYQSKKYKSPPVRDGSPKRVQKSRSGRSGSSGRSNVGSSRSRSSGSRGGSSIGSSRSRASGSRGSSRGSSGSSRGGRRR
jgi:hypothetical protein